MFLRTSSFSFNGLPKGRIFKGGLQNSLQFGSHRSSIADGNFSYYMNLSASDTFKNDSTTPETFQQMGIRGRVNYGQDFAWLCLCQYNINYIHYKFDGSGDSGDFEFYESKQAIYGDRNIFPSTRGMIDAVNPLQDNACRSWITWRNIGAVLTFNDMLEDIASKALADQYGGWEINAGSNGDVIIHQDPNETVEINYNEGTYYCDTCDEEYTDEEPCSCQCCQECGDMNPEDSETCEGCGHSLNAEEAK